MRYAGALRRIWWRWLLDPLGVRLGGCDEGLRGRGWLSPRVFWWRAKTLMSITAVDSDTRRMSISPPDDLTAIKRRLADGTG
ncbi:hypothetical protein [Kitasatospora sp. NPDC127060]|uniref:hypothetical protein n=1 Tax=Kitasatospora sp. NPDC127060 TaxID=3347121 RepID=UPI0036575CE3